MEKLLPPIDEQLFINNDAIISSIQGYKRTEIIFALWQLGILKELQKGTTIRVLINKFKLKLHELGYLFNVIKMLGLISNIPSFSRNSPFPEAIIKMEYYLAKKYTTESKIVQVLKAGLSNRYFDKHPPTKTGREIYQDAMYGQGEITQVNFNLRKIKLNDVNNVLEITSSQGIYLNTIRSKRQISHGDVIYITPWACNNLDKKNDFKNKNAVKQIKDNKKKYDLCVIHGVIHALGVNYLKIILNKMKYGSIILIDDIFLTENMKYREIGLDWLLHGGIYMATLDEFENELKRLSSRYSITKTNSLKTLVTIYL